MITERKRENNFFIFRVCTERTKISRLKRLKAKISFQFNYALLSRNIFLLRKYYYGILVYTQYYISYKNILIVFKQLKSFSVISLCKQQHVSGLISCNGRPRINEGFTISRLLLSISSLLV